MTANSAKAPIQGMKKVSKTDRKCGVSVRGVRTQKNYASCIRHPSSSSSSSSSTWTEPPSLSAVRCDPRVSLLVTGVGWDSLPLGSGDLTQRAKKGGLRQVVAKWWKEEWVGGGGGVVGRVCERMWQGGGREGGEGWGWLKEKKKGHKKIIEDISQAEAGLLRHTKLIKE